MTFQRLEIGVGDHPNLEGPDVLFTDIRDCGIRPLVACDVFAPLPFADEQFRHVASHHVIEHAAWRATDAVLKEWVRVLAIGGALHLELPDLRWQALCILYNPHDKDAVTKIFGNQDYAYDTNLHRTGFTAALLGDALAAAGCDATVVEHGGCLVADAVRRR